MGEGNAIFVGKILNAHCMWVANVNWHYDPKSTLSMGGQNVKSIYQTWNILTRI
jgi:hypothetical protein